MNGGPSTYNPERGEAVIRYAVQFLDSTCPLTAGSYSEITSVCLRQKGGDLYVEFGLPSAYSVQVATLKEPSLFVGYTGDLKPNCGGEIKLHQPLFL